MRISAYGYIYMCDAITILDDILTRIEAHQLKKHHG